MREDTTVNNEPTKERTEQTDSVVVGLVRKEHMKLSADGKSEDVGERIMLEQVDNDLTANSFIARALDSHLQETFKLVRGRVEQFKEPVNTAWNNVVGSASGAGVLTEVTREYPIRGGYGDKEKLVSIAALPNDYPTEESKYTETEALRHASHFTESNDPAVYSLGREVGHDGKGTIYITEGAYNMVKDLYLRSEGLVGE